MSDMSSPSADAIARELLDAQRERLPVAPISGRVGLRQVDVGNMVHAADANGLVLITQVDPISVVFSLPQGQLPHVLAVAYVLAAGPRDPLPFAAGSYRDVSRVAAINAGLWAELFLANRNPLLGELERLRQQMEELTKRLEESDRDGLVRIMAKAARVKEGQR